MNDTPHQCSARICNTPDCLRCLRRKLLATCVVVFEKLDNGWSIFAYQGDTPSDAAEAEFYGMISERVPDRIYSKDKGFTLNTDAEIKACFPSMVKLLGHAIVATKIKAKSFEGVRMAWRDQSQPFQQSELEKVFCRGICADDD